MNFTFAFCLSLPPTRYGNWATSIGSWPWHNKLWTFLMLYTRSTGDITYCIGSWRGRVWRSARAPTPRSRSRRTLWTRTPCPPLSRASHRRMSRKHYFLAINAIIPSLLCVANILLHWVILLQFFSRNSCFCFHYLAKITSLHYLGEYHSLPRELPISVGDIFLPQERHWQ